MRSVNEWLCSEETGEAFSHCVSCRLPLLEIDAPWLLNKDYFRDECVLEYAVCQPCRDRTSGGISEESKTAVRRFLETEIDWDARLTEFMASPDLVERFSHCIACRTPRELTDGYAISAMCDSAGNLVAGPLPLLICRNCINRMTESLSNRAASYGNNSWQNISRDHRTTARFPASCKTPRLKRARAPHRRQRSPWRSVPARRTRAVNSKAHRRLQPNPIHCSAPTSHKDKPA